MTRSLDVKKIKESPRKRRPGEFGKRPNPPGKEAKKTGIQSSSASSQYMASQSIRSKA